MKRWIVACGFLVLFFAAPHAVRAEEFIRAFNALVNVEKDGTLQIEETITLRSEGKQIKRGIFRDFPLIYRDQEGDTQRVTFKVLGVTRDGENEPWSTSALNGGVRLYIGASDKQIPSGDHTYVITYRTDNQIRFYPDHDELYWNVNGNGWLFPMDKVSASVVLPDQARPLDTRVFTGKYGEQGQDARHEAQNDFEYFTTTRRLEAGEGLTIALKLPQGTITPPGWFETLWREFRAVFLALMGFGLVGGYYLYAWMHIGRDPKAGVVVPRWNLPDGISPSLAHYVYYRGFQSKGWQAFGSAALDLAVQGYIILKDLKTTITLLRTDKPVTHAMPRSEQVILDYLDASKGIMTISPANRDAILVLGDNFCSELEKENEDKYFKRNRFYIFLGAALSCLVCGVLVYYNLADAPVLHAGDVPFFLRHLGFFIPNLIVIFMGVYRKSNLLGDLFRNIANLYEQGGYFIRFAFIGITWLVSYGFISLLYGDQIATMQGNLTALVLSVICVINIIFTILLRVTTPSGQKLLAAVRGLRQYVGLVEKDRMNAQGAPEMSPQHYEKLLPYAVALGQEKPWTRSFETWLATATALQAASYAPYWYQNDTGLNTNPIGDIDRFTTSFSHTVSSTLTPPAASGSAFGNSDGFGGGSFGGGGFSGGGGGGGGGGGW